MLFCESMDDLYLASFTLTPIVKANGMRQEMKKEFSVMRHVEDFSEGLGLLSPTAPPDSGITQVRCLPCCWSGSRGQCNKHCGISSSLQGGMQ